MYNEILKQLEDKMNAIIDYGNLKDILDNIIKIKTIKYMDLQTEILEASRKVSRN